MKKRKKKSKPNLIPYAEREAYSRVSFTFRFYDWEWDDILEPQDVNLDQKTVRKRLKELMQARAAERRRIANEKRMKADHDRWIMNRDN